MMTGFVQSQRVRATEDFIAYVTMMIVCIVVFLLMRFEIVFSAECFLTDVTGKNISMAQYPLMLLPKDYLPLLVHHLST